MKRPSRQNDGEATSEGVKKARSTAAAAAVDSRFEGVLTERLRFLQRPDDLASLAERGDVVYWMSRDQRVSDNWALQLAKNLARRLKGRLSVVFVLTGTPFLSSPLRHYDFMLRGLREVEQKLRALNIPFALARGSSTVTPAQALADWLAAQRSGTQALVMDFSPLAGPRQWKAEAHQLLAGSVPLLVEVDAHNVVPARIVSDKQEYAARTIRPKIHRLLPRFLVDDPPPGDLVDAAQDAAALDDSPPVDWPDVDAWVRATTDPSVPPVDWLQPGEDAARQALRRFVDERLADYAAARNDPANARGQSGLSPYLHFGHVSAARAAHDAQAWLRQHKRGKDSCDAFVEELVVRRELSENYCLHNRHYDSVKGAPMWAQASLADHQADTRSWLYTRDQLDQARTHDDLWNAAQRQLVDTGKMHGYLRMYWAKKILEWSPSAQEAFDNALYLNDRYSLDGRDPNGYVGVAWSVAGVHDTAWPSRPVFGKIRYMTYDGCKRKFSIPDYIRLVKNQSARLQQSTAPSSSTASSSSSQQTDQ